nr:hypothetical protein [Hyphomonas sp. Mor2]
MHKNQIRKFVGGAAAICGGVLALHGLIATSHAAQSDAGSVEADGSVTTFKARHVARWPFYGSGELSTYHSQIVMSESDDSVGVMLVSPNAYCGDIIVRFDVMPLRAATALVTNLATTSLDSEELTFPEGYDANVTYMFETPSMYNFIYHAAPHSREGPFLRRFPEPGNELLSPASEHFVEMGKYSSVEFGRVGSRVWFAVDGETAVEYHDDAPLQDGHVVLRIRGTAHERAGALFRDIEIENQPDPAICG